MLSVTVQVETLKEAGAKAYAAINTAIDLEDGFCRRDIAYQAL